MFSKFCEITQAPSANIQASIGVTSQSCMLSDIATILAKITWDTKDEFTPITLRLTINTSSYIFRPPSPLSNVESEHAHSLCIRRYLL